MLAVVGTVGGPLSVGTDGVILPGRWSDVCGFAGPITGEGAPVIWEWLSLIVLAVVLVVAAVCDLRRGCVYNCAFCKPGEDYLLITQTAL